QRRIGRWSGKGQTRKGRDSHRAPSGFKYRRGTQACCLRAALRRTVLVVQSGTPTTARPADGGRRDGSRYERLAASRRDEDDITVTRARGIPDRDLAIVFIYGNARHVLGSRLVVNT